MPTAVDFLRILTDSEANFGCTFKESSTKTPAQAGGKCYEQFKCDAVWFCWGNVCPTRHCFIPERLLVAAPAVNPAALGLAAFALTTFVLSFGNAGIIPAGAVPVVFSLALFYGGAVQVLAGLWEFAQKNTFGATAFCSYGAFWMSFWYLNTATDLGKAGTGLAVGIGTWLLAWAIFTLYMTFAAWRTNVATFLVFVALTLTFFVLAFGAYGSMEWMTKLGGWLGILTALLAWYASFAVVINSTFKRVVLPVGPNA